jgi:glyoxylase-like metal-dependent hydrolase (beta-lactamase superfamily II)
VPRVLFRQLVDDDLGCASYLIGDEQAGEALVVDPPYAIEPCLAAAAELGVRLTRVLETHTHADHVSGHGRLALEHGLPVAIHSAAEPAYPFEPLADGDEITVGSVTVRVLHTPGHRPEHCCFLAGDALVTGDSLFVGSTPMRAPPTSTRACTVCSSSRTTSACCRAMWRDRCAAPG